MLENAIIMNNVPFYFHLKFVNESEISLRLANTVEQLLSDDQREAQGQALLGMLRILECMAVSASPSPISGTQAAMMDRENSLLFP